MIQRRRLLTAAALAPAMTLAQARGGGAWPFDTPYAPVLSAPSREIRTVVGLRPYRETGFVLKREKFGRRTVIHNYGHGGCGVTLSLGCAKFAADEAASVDETRAAVIGAGVIGLTTALALLRRGFTVRIFAAELPPDTTSNIAAGYWHPTTLFRRSLVDDAFLDRFRAAARNAHHAFARLANDPAYGVRWIRNLELRDTPPSVQPDPAFEGDDLYPGLGREEDSARWFGYGHVTRFHAMMIDADIFLRALMRDIENAGGRIVQKYFETPDDVFDLKERLIFNCTGLGARDLFGDDALTPVRGQLTYLLPQSEIDYGYSYYSPGNLLYMYPRRGAIVLGGTFERGEWSREVKEPERLRMLAGHAEIAQRIAAQR